MKNTIKLELLILLLTTCFLLASQSAYSQACDDVDIQPLEAEYFDSLPPSIFHWHNNVDTILFSDPNNPTRGLFVQVNSGINPAFQGNSLYAHDLTGDTSQPSLDPFEFIFRTGLNCDVNCIYEVNCSGFDYAAHLDSDTIFVHYIYGGQAVWDTFITDNGSGVFYGSIQSNLPWSNYLEVRVSGNLDGPNDWFEMDNFNFRIDSQIPVTYEHFTAKALGNEVLLDWKTSEELNNQGFDIERSYDGINFTTIGHVYADEINTEGRDYQFLDKNPGAELLYYRLNQIDADGTHTYSDIISVVMEAGNELKLDVQEGQLRFLHAQQDQKIAFSIYDLSGKLIQQGQVIGENYVQTTPQSGIYLIHYNQNGAMLQAKVLLR